MSLSDWVKAQWLKEQKSSPQEMREDMGRGSSFKLQASSFRETPN